MNDKEKLSAYNRLKNTEHVEKDLQLLKGYAPNHELVATVKANKANEVLYALLDYASYDEVVHNRRGKQSIESTPVPDSSEVKIQEETVSKEQAIKPRGIIERLTGGRLPKKK